MALHLSLPSDDAQIQTPTPIIRNQTQLSAVILRIKTTVFVCVCSMRMVISATPPRKRAVLCILVGSTVYRTVLYIHSSSPPGGWGSGLIWCVSVVRVVSFLDACHWMRGVEECGVDCLLAYLSSRFGFGVACIPLVACLVGWLAGWFRGRLGFSDFCVSALAGVVTHLVAHWKGG